MSSEEFLKRWSRRKQEARSSPPVPTPDAGEGSVAGQALPDVAAAPPEPTVDLSKLPSIDSITSATDITDFLRKGIPAELSRAALRRAWAADPAIRDFVGLAENAWDFTDPDAMPGFGPLESTPEQIGAMLERVIGGARETAEKVTSELAETVPAQEKHDAEPRGPASMEVPEEPAGSEQSPPAPSAQLAAVQPEAGHEDGDDVPVRRRTHGGAMPS